MRVAVTGATGGLGRFVLRELPRCVLGRHPVDVVWPLPRACDVRDGLGVLNALDGYRPHVVVHLAAMTDVGRCEREPAVAVAVNAIGTANVARACATIRARLIYMSTDAVFSGEGFHGQGSLPSPASAYGWSKLAGEQAVAALGEDGLVLRANFFTRHCRGKTSFAAYVVREAQQGHPFVCYGNVRSTPVHASSLAKVIARAVSEKWSGLAHVASSDCVTRVEQAALICRAYGLPYHVQAVQSDRPSDGRLHADRGLCGTVEEEVAKLVSEEPLTEEVGSWSRSS